MKTRNAAALAATVTLAGVLGARTVIRRISGKHRAIEPTPPKLVLTPRKWPDTPAKVTRRAELASQISTTASQWNEADLWDDEGKGAQILLQMLDPTKQDHTAVVIAAHKLLIAQAVRDLQDAGQTHEGYTAVLNLIGVYLDNEGWHYCESASGGEWRDTDPSDLTLN